MTVAPAPQRAAQANPGQSAVDAVASGLAAIAAERTLAGVYRATCGLAARLSGVSGVALLRPGDRGFFGVAHAIPEKVPETFVSIASASLHQRWIAAHAPAAPTTGPGLYVVEDRPELLIVPLVRGDSLLGGLVLVGRDGPTPAATAAERLSVGAIGVVAAQAMEGIVQRQRLELSISRVEHDSELTTARKAISRELHDGPTQDLALAGLTLDRLVLSLGEDQAISADARQARDLIDRAVLGMRKAIGKLRSSQPPAPSITGPLRELLAEMAPAAPGLEVNFQEVSGVQLAPEVERAMIGIVREALHNVRKHADAESVRLEVRRVEDAVEIAVIDDGVGFEGPSPTGHFGLEQIRELAEEMGGRLETRSAHGAGTSVKAWIPLASPAASQRRRA
ncbi:MAG TPA: ATP-binding protein [Thermomicrobiales bacterium]|nr:ATP-binding protein [Thermomicrobiales bacterium]